MESVNLFSYGKEQAKNFNFALFYLKTHLKCKA